MCIRDRGNALDAGFQLLQKLVVDALVDNGARAGRTFLALKTERGLRNAFYGRVDVGVGIDDDGVFAAHFEDGALDPHLARLLMRRSLIDVQSDLARAGECDVANLRMRHQRVAEACASEMCIRDRQFTATAVMMLVEEGKIGLEDPITKYFPDAPDTWKQVTIRELLSHTAGFTDYPKSFDMRKDYTEAQLLKIVEGIPLAYTPGTSWSYSNLGYLTLGIVIHKVTGEFYGDFLQERIFRPLDMNTARIISEADIVPNRSAGYRLVKGELKNQEWVAPALNTTADGSLYFSIEDLAQWDAALYTEKLLKRSSLEQMWTVAKLKNGQPNSGHYGFGWLTGKRNGHPVVEHEGSWQGFETDISRYVEDQLTVAVLTNLAESKPYIFANHVAEMYLSGAPK